MGNTFTISGIDEIRKAFKELPAKLANKVIRQAIRAALRPVLVEVKRLVPVDTGLLRSAVKLRAAAKRRRGQIKFEVRVGEGDFKGEQFYAAIVNYGSKKRPGAFFMERAYEAKKDEAKRIATEMIRQGIDTETSK